MIDLLSTRTLLFTPGNHPERFEKARSIGADGIIIDLEDAVSFSEKDHARGIVVDYLTKRQAYPNFVCCVRINGLQTLYGWKDIMALISAGVMPDAIMLPKSEEPALLKLLDKLLPSAIPYLLIIETTLGVQQVDALVGASPNVKGICFGAADYAADFGAINTWETMLFARSKMVNAAGSVGIAALDVPYFKFQESDMPGLLDETTRAKALGFTGKLAIHPKQIAPILSIFTPAATEVEYAKKVVDAYEKAGGNVCEIDGKMIDVPIVRSARRILALANR